MYGTKIFVAGHRGMVGSAIVRQLEKDAANEIVTASRAELDLTNQAAVDCFFRKHRFDQVYLAAAKVGGIHANNTYPADFIYDNLMIAANVIQAAHQSDVQKLLFLGSSCIYPRMAAQPMSESALLTGSLEPTNEPYAIAKIAGIKLCESYNRQHQRDYRSVMPTNLYGPGDNFHPENSHVVPALLRRFHQAKVAGLHTVTAWGTGQPRREFLHVKDLASAAVFLMAVQRSKLDAMVRPMESHINIGSGIEHTIQELTEAVAETVGYTGTICWDRSKPDGAPRKLMSSERIRALGWRPTIGLSDGLKDAYSDFVFSKLK